VALDADWIWLWSYLARVVCCNVSAAQAQCPFYKLSCAAGSPENLESFNSFISLRFWFFVKPKWWHKVVVPQKSVITSQLNIPIDPLR